MIAIAGATSSTLNCQWFRKDHRLLGCCYLWSLTLGDNLSVCSQFSSMHKHTTPMKHWGYKELLFSNCNQVHTFHDLMPSLKCSKKGGSHLFVGVVEPPIRAVRISGPLFAYFTYFALLHFSKKPQISLRSQRSLCANLCGTLISSFFLKRILYKWFIFSTFFMFFLWVEVEILKIY